MADEKQTGARNTRSGQQAAEAAAQDRGYSGEVPDDEPNDAYTLRGQASRKIPPGHPGGPAPTR